MASSDRANWSCPSCESSDVFREGGKVFECRSCGEQIYECILEHSETLQNLAEREDEVGALAGQLLETGGIAPE
ncbi:hypothetical protein G9C85_09395 [Halorubellus sp. JP-L1]|uniref:hypothetical protein n=1 Tax=Halorubellus sp. JP-L1 TaxID=2715753 RepID=UPI00140B8181|nr:hypothetical protein [Halorubellus sp. JP-L1]NHN41843.1 hypothetical protein [Halorubellus sp. JP-L1]